MNTIRSPKGHTFYAHCDMLDVTSMSRPNTAWTHVDAEGHEHRWYMPLNEQQTPAAAYRYDPQVRYTLPTLVKVHDGWDYWEDGERTERWHYACKTCGEPVRPGYKADDYEQYIPGIKSYYVDGQLVRREEFFRLLKEEFPDFNIPEA